MDYQTALTDFSGVLKVAADSLERIAAAQAPPADHLRELNQIAIRLREFGERIAEISA